MSLTFTAFFVRGRGRGKTIGTPTINLDPSVLTGIERQGIYAVWVTVDHERLPAVMHAGDRPVFNDDASVEIHFLVPPPVKTPQALTVKIVEFLRPIENFDSVEELQAQIRRDIEHARATLGIDAA